MNFTLRQLQYFDALSRHGHFGHASDACNVSQPALSVQIRALEDLLGGALVERRPRSVILTPFGRQILPLVRAVLGAAQTLESASTGVGELRGNLTLGLIPTVAPYLLPETLATLRARDISLRIEVREAQTERLIAALRKGEIDAAVIALPSGDPGLAEHPLFDDRFLLAASSARPHRPRILSPADLGQSPLMLLEDGHCLTDQALDLCKRDRAEADIQTGASSLATLSRLVAAGFGLTLMPEIASGTEAAATPGLTLSRFAAPEPARTIGLVRRDSTAEAQWFQDLAGVLQSVGHNLTQSARNCIA